MSNTTAYKEEVQFSKSTGFGLVNSEEMPRPNDVMEIKLAKSKRSKTKRVSDELRRMGADALREDDAGMTEDFPT